LFFSSLKKVTPGVGHWALVICYLSFNASSTIISAMGLIQLRKIEAKGISKDPIINDYHQMTNSK